MADFIYDLYGYHSRNFLGRASIQKFLALCRAPRKRADEYIGVDQNIAPSRETGDAAYWHRLHVLDIRVFSEPFDSFRVQIEVPFELLQRLLCARNASSATLLRKVCAFQCSQFRVFGRSRSGILRWARGCENYLFLWRRRFLLCFCPIHFFHPLCRFPVLQRIREPTEA